MQTRAKEVKKQLKSLIPALRERLWDMYDAYFPARDGSKNLVSKIEEVFKNESKLAEEILKILEESKTWDISEAMDDDSDSVSDQESSSASPESKLDDAELLDAISSMV